MNAANNGRGGPSAAVRKYGVSPISIGNWSKSTKGAKGSKTKPGPIATPAKKVESAWDELVRLKSDISVLENELQQKQDRFDKVKGKI